MTSEEDQLKTPWSVNQTNPGMADILDKALREVVDPELGFNIIELGLIQNIEIKEDQAHITMIMTTPFCPYAPALLEMTRKKAEEAIELHTTISLGLDPWDPTMMEDGIGADWGFF